LHRCLGLAVGVTALSFELALDRSQVVSDPGPASFAIPLPGMQNVLPRATNTTMLGKVDRKPLVELLDEFAVLLSS
jgi:hypothetical protein